MYRSFVAVFALGTVAVIYDRIGPFMAGEYYTLILWGIRLFTFASFACIAWRLYVGCRDGHLLFDDLDD